MDVTDAGMLFHVYACLHVFGSSGEQLPLDQLCSVLQNRVPFLCLLLKGFISHKVFGETFTAYGLH